MLAVLLPGSFPVGMLGPGHAGSRCLSASDHPSQGHIHPGTPSKPWFPWLPESGVERCQQNILPALGMECFPPGSASLCASTLFHLRSDLNYLGTAWDEVQGAREGSGIGAESQCSAGALFLPGTKRELGPDPRIPISQCSAGCQGLCSACREGSASWDLLVPVR